MVYTVGRRKEEKSIGQTFCRGNGFLQRNCKRKEEFRKEKTNEKMAKIVSKRAGKVQLSGQNSERCRGLC